MINTKHRFIKEDFEIRKSEVSERRSKVETSAIRPQAPVLWHKAKDFYVFDKDGNKWIDMTAGIFVSNAGHSNPDINEAIKEQLDRDLSYAFLYDTEIRVEFMERLLEASPPHFDKTILLNSGTEATDVAYKLIKLWAKKNNKKYIVTFNGSYHGRALSCDLLCGNKKSVSWSSISDDDVYFIDFPYESDTKFDPNLLPPADQIAAFFLETYQGWGAWMYPTDYINDLYSFARKSGALICFDEVQAGFYRMSSMYGYETYNANFKPDLICLGKGISSSLPLAAVLGTEELIDVDDSVVLGSTHSGNALCCAAAIANLRFLQGREFQDELIEKSFIFENRSAILLNHDSVTHVNTRGMVTGIIFKDTETANKVVDECLINGVLPVCTFKNAIKLGPPLTISIDAIKEAMGVISNAIVKVENGV